MKSIRRTYYLIVSLFWLGTALPMALTMLLAQARGISLFEISLLVGVYSLTIVLLEVPTGGLADAIGRKTTTALAYGCITIASVVLLLAFSFPAFVAGFMLIGVGRALASGALEAWFIDSLQALDPQIELQPDLARANTYALLALAGGSLLGSLMPYLFPHLPADGTAVLTPLAIPLVLATGLHLTTLLTTLFLVKEQRPVSGMGGWRQQVGQTNAHILTAFTLSRRNPTILRLMGATAASGLAVISMETLWQPFFADFLGGGTEHTVWFGVIASGNFMVGVAGNLLATPLSRWLNQRYALVCALFQGLPGLTMIILAWQTGLPGAIGLYWLVYLQMSVVNSPHSALLNQEIPAAQRSAMLSLESLVGYLGAMVGSVGLGFVAEQSSIGAAWIIGGAILMVSLGLYLQVDASQRVNYAQKIVSLNAD